MTKKQIKTASVYRLALKYGTGERLRQVLEQRAKWARQVYYVTVGFAVTIVLILIVVAIKLASGQS